MKKKISHVMTAIVVNTGLMNELKDFYSSKCHNSGGGC